MNIERMLPELETGALIKVRANVAVRVGKDDPEAINLLEVADDELMARLEAPQDG